MKYDGIQKIRDSEDLTDGEKMYIFDVQYRMAGGFKKALFDAISHADETNIARLALGFPKEVQGFLAWSRGDLHARASLIAGGDVGFIEGNGEEALHGEHGNG